MTTRRGLPSASAARSMISRSLGVIFTHSLAGAASTIALGLGYSGLSASWAERGAARARAASDAMEHNLFMVISRLVPLVLSLSTRRASVAQRRLSKEKRGSTGSPLTDYISNILFVSTLNRQYHLRKRESRTRETALSDIRPDSRVGRHLRRRGRVVDRARLESVYRATYRGFESLRLRHHPVSTHPELTRETRSLLRVSE